MSFPSRVHDLAGARRLYGDRVDRLAAFLGECDPLADAAVESFAALPPGRGFALLDEALRNGIDAVVARDVPPALRALFAEVDRVPAWVDWDRIDRGGALLLRSGPFGGMVLAFRSLVLAYAAPGGNKPLVLSGKLTEHAPRRLAETGRFVHAVSLPGSLHRFGQGFAITIKVRLMHAQVRRLARASGKWKSDAWGEPINQHDMLGTLLVFSVALVDGLRTLGFRMTDDEVDAYFHLWRYVGALMGVHPELLFSNERDARAFGEVMASIQGPADDDGRALVAALFDSGDRPTRSRTEAALLHGYRRFLQGLARGLVGDRVADELALRDDAFRYAIPVLRPTIGAFERLRERSPRLQRLAVKAGDDRWNRVLRAGLGDRAPEYRPPEGLTHVRTRAVKPADASELRAPSRAAAT